MELTPRQREVKLSLLCSDIKHILLAGGSRSGKTFLLTDTVVRRAIKAPGSRHTINRFRFNSCKQSIGMETLPAVMSTSFPNLKYEINKTDWVCYFENNSEIWLSGLDDKERTEKVLGKEYATVFNNEVSQIPFGSRELMYTRLAQKVNDIDGIPLKVKELNDCNPPSISHWSYKLFLKKVNPEDGTPLKNPDNYAFARINPRDNLDNIAADYIESLESQSARLRKRFLEGEFSDDNPTALFNEINFDVNRVINEDLPQMLRVIIAIDPSGSNGKDNDGDAIGIIVVGLGIDGKAYVIEDLTCLTSPAGWGNIAVSAFDRNSGSLIVGEGNYGGAMVEHVIKSVRRNIPYKKVTAIKSKADRALSASALYEQNKVRHVGYLSGLEDELLQFSQGAYLGDKSPNRADALIHALKELFNQITKEEKPLNKIVVPSYSGSWMHR